MNQITKQQIEKYIQKLRARGESTSVIGKKLKSIEKFIDWAHKQNIINTSNYQKIKEEIDKYNLEFRVQNLELKERIKNFLTENLRKMSLRGKSKTTDETTSTNNKLASPIRENPLGIRENLSLQHYIGFVILLIFMALLGAGLYNRFFLKSEKTFAYPTSPTTRGGRLLSFQGRLTDTIGNPITTATNVQFKLYNVSTGGSSLYATGACSTTPDQDGIFNVLIGGSGYTPTPPQSVCGTEPDATIFSENPNVYMGVTVGTDSEMTPRQQIANVGYAINAETLQGYPPGTTINSIPYISNAGDLLIAASTPGIRSTYASATFALTSANAVTIQSAGSGDVVLQATESGTMRLRTGGSSDAYTRIFIANTGNVGIGTTTPGAYKLDVNGSANATTLYQGGNQVCDFSGNCTVATGYWIQGTNGILYPKNATVDLLVGGTATSSAKFAFMNVNSGTPTASISATTGSTYLTGTGIMSTTNMLPMVLGSATTGTIQLSPKGTTGLYVSGAGNVGIGTTSPTQMLDIVSAGSSKLFVRTTNTSTDIPAIQVGQSNNYYGELIYDSTNDYLALRSVNNGTPNTGIYLPYNSSNVGIGTTAPSQKLEIDGNLKFTTATNKIVFQDDNGNISRNGQTIQFTAGYGASGNYPGLTLTQNGNLTGTSGTSSNLYIPQTVAPTSGTLSYNSIYLSSTINQTGGANGITRGLYIDPTLTAAADWRSIEVTKGNVLFGTTSGNVGIGTTTPGYRLDVSGTANATTLYQGGNQVCDFSGNCTVATGYWIQGTNGILYPKNTTVDLLVGGTATSSAKFAFMNVNSGNPTASISGNLAIASPTGANPATTYNVLNGGTLNFQRSVGGDAGLTSTMFMDRYGNVGIGTTTPSSILHTVSSATTTNSNTFAANSLTTGNLMYLTSTSTALSSGGLFSLDWSPGSSTTATGDLMSLNIGTNGTIGNLLNIKDTNSSLFSVSETAVTSNLPTSFTSPGDVSMAYDLVFTNPTASYIKSSAPLYITSGETFNSSDLNLKTYNSGDIVLDAGGSTSATGTVKFYDSNIKGAINTTPIQFATASAAINTFRNLYSDESVIGALNDVYTMASGGIGGVWMDAGTYIYPTAAGSSTMAIMDNGNVGIGTTAPTTKFDLNGNLKVSGYATASASLTVGYTSVPGGVGNAVFSGNVGVGTTSPRSQVSIGAYLDLASSGSGLGTGLPNIRGSSTGNIIVNPGTSGSTYLSYDAGTAGVLFGNGSSTVVGRVNSSGYATFGSASDLASTNYSLYTTGKPVYINGDATNTAFFMNGNVGIGTTTPGAYKLDINGGANATTLYQAGNQVCDFSGNCTVATGYWIQGTNGILYPKNTTVDLLVGGTATSSAKFAFMNVNSGTPTASISATTGSTYLTGTGTMSTTNMLPMVLGSATTGTIQLSPKGTTGLYVDGVGNVGVGTTTPTAKLHVNGVGGVGLFGASNAGGTNSLRLDNPDNTNASSNTQLRITVGGGSAGDPYIQFDDNTSSFNWAMGADNSDSNKFKIAYTGTGLGTGTDVITMLTGGNVGVGTTAPLSKLGVLGNLSVGATYGAIAAPTSGAIIEGNVGIGTTTPTSKLTVEDGSSYYQIAQKRTSSSQILWSGAVWDTIGSFVGNNAYYSGSYYFNPNYTAASGINFRQDGSTEFWNDTGLTPSVTYIPTKRMTILNNGNVGIGTTAPSQVLHVSGNARLTGALYDVNNEAGTSSQVLSTTGTGVDWVDAGSVGTRWSSLTNPTANLSLSMGTYTTTFNWATGTSTNNLFNYTTDASSNGTGNLVNIATGTSSTVKPFHVSAAGTEAIQVLANGNVGIGTTGPTSGYKLDIAGDIALSGGSRIIRTVGTNNNLDINANGTGTLTLDTTGAGTITVGTNATTLNIGAGSSTETLNIGNSTGNDTINIATSTGTDTVNLLTSSSGTQALNIGNSANGATLVAYAPATTGTGYTWYTNALTSGYNTNIYSNSITSGNLLRLTHATSTFTGTGLYMDLGTSSGTFSGNFLDLRNAGTSRLNISNKGAITATYTTAVAGEANGLHVLTYNNSYQTAANYQALNVAAGQTTIASAATGGTDQTLDNYEAFKFSSGSYDNLGGVTIRLRKSSTTGSATNAYIIASLYSDNSGQPGTAVANSSGIYLNQISTSNANYSFSISSTLTASTNYWIVVRKYNFASTDGIIFDTTTTGSSEWAYSADAVTWTIDTTTKGYYYVYTRGSRGIVASGYASLGIYGSSTNNYGVQGVSTNSYGIYGTSSYNYAGAFVGGSGVSSQTTNSDATGYYNFTNNQRRGTRYSDLMYNTWFIGEGLNLQEGSPVYTTYYYVYDGASYTDYTTQLRYPGGSAITIIPNNTSYFYMGRSSSAAAYRQFFFDFANTPNVSSLVWEQATAPSDGTACTTWTPFTPTTDETNGMVQDGMVQLNTGTITNCSVNGQAGYWFRVSAGTVTTAPTSTAANFGMFTGNFARYYGAGLEKYRVDYVGNTLTTGYIAPGTSTESTALQSSRYMYDTGLSIGFNTNVSIATNSARGSFEVYNGNDSSSQVLFTQDLRRSAINLISDYGAGNYIPGIVWSTQNNSWDKPKAGIYLQTTSSGSNMIFGTSNDYPTGITNNALFIQYSGNIGIGNTAPESKLNVDSGNLNIEGYLADEQGYGIVFEDDEGTDTDFWISRIDSDSNGGTDNDRLSIGDGTTIGTNTFMSIDTAGNIGIGTTAPGYKLDVNGSANATTLYQGGNQVCDFSGNCTVATGYWIQGTNGILYPKNATVDLLVGGTATNSAKFAFMNVNSGTPTASISATTGSTYLTGTGTMSTTNMLPMVLGSATTGTIQLSPKGTTGLYVDGVGNVGVGTTGPVSKLHLQSTTTGAAKLLKLQNSDTTTNSSAEIEFGVTGTATVTSKISSIRTNRAVGGDSDLAFYTFTNSGLNERLRIQDTGNIGIGTTAPTQLLHLYKAASQNSSLEIHADSAYDTSLDLVEGTGAFGAAGSGGFSTIYDGGDNNYYIKSANGATINTRLTIERDSGNIGIGTTTPGQKLDIVGGNARIASGNSVYIGGPTDTGTDGLRMHHSGSSAYIDMKGSGGLFFRADNSNGGTDRMYIGNAGNVGIGTTAPLSKLGVLGNLSVGATYGAIAAQTSGAIIEGNVGIGTTNPDEKLTVTGGDIRITDSGKGLKGTNDYYMIASADSTTLQVGSGAGWTTGITFVPGGNEAMRIQSNGNVGIGTTAPTSGYKLDVNGNVNATGYYMSRGYLNPTTDNLVYNGDFETNSLDGWSGFDSVSTTAYSGNYSARADGSSTVLSDDYIPVDPDYDVFQLEGYFQKLVAGGTPGVLYFGYIAYDASKTAITTAPCGTYCYFSASSYTLPVDSTWHKFSATTTGEGTSYPNFPVNTKYVRVLVLINYGASADAVTLMDHLTLKRVNHGPLFVGNNFTSTNLVDQQQVTKLYTTSTNNFIITPPSSGNVGIGTTAPGGNLDIDGSLLVGNEGIYDRDDGIINIKEDLQIEGDDLYMTTNTANYFLMADGTNFNPVTPAAARTGLGLDAGGTGDIWVEKAGDTMTGPLVMNSTYIDIDRDAATDSGIQWYSSSYNAWADYMAQAAQTSVGPRGTLTAPSGTFVTSWAQRSFIESASTYGWTFESGAWNSTTPAVVFEIRASDGLFHSYGSGMIDGNVGIGTTAPGSYRLYVNGADAYFTHNIYAAKIVDITGSNAYYLDPADATKSLTVAGNVGIGTTAPTAKLDIAGDASSSGSLVLRGSTPTTLDILNGSNFSVLTSVGGDTGLTTRMMVMNSGNVGIGSTTPASKFTVSDSVSAFIQALGNNNTGIYSDNYNASPNNSITIRTGKGSYASPSTVADGTGIGGLYFSGHDGSNFISTAGISVAIDGTPGTNDMPGRLMFSTTADGASSRTEHMRITSGGNIGIGTTAPQTKLHIGAGTDAPFCPSCILHITQAGDTGISVRDSTNDVNSILYASSWGGMVGTGTNHNFFIRTNDTNRMTFDTGGNVGIGTTAPTAKLQIFGNDTTQVASISAQTGKAALLVDNTIGDLFTASSSGKIRFTVQQDGNVSINGGTISPSADTMLLVGGKIKSSANTPEFRLYNNGATAEWSFRMASNSDHNLHISKSVGGSYTDYVNIDTSGNVGIGTTAPTAALHVAGSPIDGTPNAEGIQIGVNSNYASIEMTGTNGGYIDFQNDTSGTDYDMRLWQRGNDWLQIIGGTTDFNGNIIQTDGVNALGSSGSYTPNPGFEVNDDSTTTVADSWTSLYGGNYSFAVTTSNVYQGAKSQELTVGTAGAGNWAAVQSMCLPISESTYYNLKFAAKQSVASSGLSGIVEEYTTLANCTSRSGYNNLTFVNGVTGTTSWAMYGVGTDLQTSAGRYWARVTIWNFAPGTANTTTIDSVTFSASSATWGVDLAETYPVSETNPPQSGHLVKMSNNISPETNIAIAEKTSSSYDANVFGIVSTKPEITFDDGKKYSKAKIALNGRVPAIVSTENGNIGIGDHITSSSISGIGMVATKPGRTVGKALQSTENWNENTCNSVNSLDEIQWPDDDGTNSAKPCYKLPNGTYVGKIMVFVNLSWYEPPTIMLTSSGDVKIEPVNTQEYVFDGTLKEQIQNSEFRIQNLLGETVNEIKALAELVVGKITAGLIDTQNAIVNNTLVAKNIVAENINLTSDNLTIAGQKINEYIDNRINQILNSKLLTLNSEKVVSPIVETENIIATGDAKLNTITTNEIKPQNQDLVINLNSSIAPDSTAPVEKGQLAKLIIKGLEGKTAAIIDSTGNASFSGQLVANSLQINTNATISGQFTANEASISGKLIASQIESENIKALEEQTASNSSTLATNINDVQQLLARIKDSPLPDTTNQTNISNVANLSELTVSGNTNLYNLSVSGSLLTGSLMIENNSILALASDLRLSSLRGNIVLFENAVVIASDGTITTQGEIIAQKGIRTNEIKAINDQDNVNINNLAINNLTINNISTNSAIIAAAENFSQNGIFAPAIETASTSAGMGILPENSSEVIIYNNNVKENSLVYLTPSSSTPQTAPLTVVKKYSGNKSYFKVATNTPTPMPIKFDWLIIN